MSEVNGSGTARQEYCYRHPNRVSYALCQRCVRVICPECQVQAPVGVHCVECVRNAQRAAAKNSSRSKQSSKLAAWFKTSANPVTISLLVVMVAVYLLQVFVPGFTDAFLYAPLYTEFGINAPFEPWRMLTAVFLHSTSGLYHIAFNALSLWLLGSQLERYLGTWRFLALFFLSGFGGSVAVQLFSPLLSAVVGASGAIFGLLGATAVISKKLSGGVSKVLITVIAINLISGFLMSGISWEAHLGGLVVGSLTALIFFRWANRKGNTEILMLSLFSAILVGLSLLLAVV